MVSQFSSFKNPLLWVTLLYLIFELSFSARLLDVAGGVSSQDDIDGIERYGRMLSGIATGLFLYSWLKNKEWIPFNKVVLVFIIFIFSFVLMYQIQESIVRSLIDRLSDEERKQAVVLAIAAPQIASGDVDIANQQYGEGGIDSASAKSFVALFPALALYKENIDKDIEKLTPLFVKSQLTRSCEAGTEGCIGDSQAFHNNVWAKIVEESQNKYNAMVESYQSETSSSSIKKQQNKAWKRHVSAVRSKTGYDPDNVPEYMHDKIRGRLKKDHGLILPYGWNPSDRSLFNNAVSNKIYRQADKSLSRQLGRSIPNNLSFEWFFKQKGTQEHIRETLNITNKKMTFPLVYTHEESERYVYNRVLEYFVDKELSRLNSDAKEFAPEGKHAELGESAAKRVFVPAVALFFSLLGGLGHFMKSGALIMESWVTLWTGFVRMLISVIVVSVIMFVFSNPVIESKPYQILSESIKEKNGTVLALGAEWIIRMESAIYPFNNWLRMNVLQGLNFGAMPRDEVTDS